MSSAPPSATAVDAAADAPAEHAVTAFLEALKTVAVALKETSVPFALAGSYAVYARGGPDSRHDVDFVIAEDDAPGVLQGLARRGMTIIEPPEDWLFKIDHEGIQVDMIFRLAHRPVDADMLARVDDLIVDSVRMPVLSATDLLLSKLWALGEHNCDLAPILTLVRSLREQIDADLVARESAGNPYAEAALSLVRSLGLLMPGAAPPRSQGATDA